MYAFPHLPHVIGYEMFARLLAMLPPPLDASPEAREDRNVVAMCMLKQMGPLKTAEEASLAITVVAADAHAHDALRGAVENHGDFKAVMQCRAQANAMMRTRHKASAELDTLVRSRMAAARLAEHDDRMRPGAEMAARVEDEPRVTDPSPPDPAPAEAEPVSVEQPNKPPVVVSFSRPAPAMAMPSMGPSTVGRAVWRGVLHDVIHCPVM